MADSIAGPSSRTVPSHSAVHQALLHLPPSTDPTRLTTPQAVKRALADLSKHKAALDEALDTSIQTSEERIEASKRSIASLAPQIDLLTEEALVLRHRLTDAAETSDRISGAVRDFDEKRRRVRQAAQWVSWCQDLKASLISLSSSIDVGDWETAVRHAQKAMRIPTEVIHSEFAKRVVPHTEQPLPPDQTLDTLRTVLLDVFTTKFKKATQENDEAQASRFFKLFPQVGWRNEGLAVYCSFAQGLIREKGKTILDATTRGASLQLQHAQLLTALFEQLALLIDTHQTVVDRHYGKGNFAAGVMPGLQEECDYIGSRIVEHWIEKTSILRRLDEARVYNFTFLANLGNSATNSDGKPSSAKPSATSFKYGLPGRPSTPSGINRSGTPSNAQNQPEEPQPPDGREIDRLLGELATMAARWATYRRFLRGRLENTDEDQTPTDHRQRSPGDGMEEGEIKDFRRSSLDGSTRPSLNSLLTAPEEAAEPITAEKILEGSKLGQKMNNLLLEVYSPLEAWYLRSSIEKAHKIDKPDHNIYPWTSSVLDDSFFLLRAALSRLLSTSHIPTLNNTLKAIRNIADEDYIQVLVRRMEMTWRNVGGALSGPDGPRKEIATREMRLSFVLYTNILSTSSRYSARILGDLSSEQNLSQYFFTETELKTVTDLLSGLSVLPSRSRSACQTEIEHLFNTLTRPRIRTMLNDSYREVSYNIRTEEEFAASEEASTMIKRFTRSLENHLITLNAFRDSFIEENWEIYFDLVVTNIVDLLESFILSSQRRFTFTELGALRFDKDWRSLAAFLSNFTASGQIRDKFARLQQVAYVLSLDEEEVNASGASLNPDESLTSGGIYDQGTKAGYSWRLSAAEVEIVRNLRI
ncbi:unnamed protein product [Sympodiomycopsis kandeliae]